MITPAKTLKQFCKAYNNDMMPVMWYKDGIINRMSRNLFNVMQDIRSYIRRFNANHKNTVDVDDVKELAERFIKSINIIKPAYELDPYVDYDIDADYYDDLA